MNDKARGALELALKVIVLASRIDDARQSVNDYADSRSFEGDLEVIFHDYDEARLGLDALLGDLGLEYPYDERWFSNG